MEVLRVEGVLPAVLLHGLQLVRAIIVQHPIVDVVLLAVLRHDLQLVQVIMVVRQAVVVVAPLRV